jgi:putative hydrolase of HD superfamily
MTPSKEEYRDGLVAIGKLVFDFAKVYRVTYHDDGHTPESDTDHTVMLSVVACSLAEAFYKEELDRGLVAQFAIVHDLVEVYAGDVNSFGLTKEGKVEKEHREKRALYMIEDAFVNVYPWIPRTIREYERLDTKEARFVKSVDKMMAKITHILNKGKAYKEKRISKEEVERELAKQIETMQTTYTKEFPVIVSLMKVLVEESIKKTYD